MSFLIDNWTLVLVALTSGVALLWPVLSQGQGLNPAEAVLLMNREKAVVIDVCEPHEFAAKKIIFATGYYDVPNLLRCPGEELPKVLHYYKEAHPYYDQDVLVIGAKNSAVIAALELWWSGAHVTMVHRGDAAPATCRGNPSPPSRAPAAVPPPSRAT